MARDLAPTNSSSRHPSRTQHIPIMTGLSPLPVPCEEDNDDHARRFKGVARILGPSWAHLPTVTIGLLGVQIFWSVEMSYGLYSTPTPVLGFSEISS